MFEAPKEIVWRVKKLEPASSGAPSLFTEKGKNNYSASLSIIFEQVMDNNAGEGRSGGGGAKREEEEEEEEEEEKGEEEEER